MSSILPPNKPRLSTAELAAMLRDKHPVTMTTPFPLLIVGIRGYYLNTMGKPGANDRNLYDDAIFIVTDSAFAAYNANTDPSYYRNGIATLCPGFYPSYKFALHKGKYLALCQRVAPVVVLRDGAGHDRGMFGINIHRGSLNTTSSEGCQTIHPSQWNSFIALAKDQAQRYFGDKWNNTTIPYILMENK